MKSILQLSFLALCAQLSACSSPDLSQSADSISSPVANLRLTEELRFGNDEEVPSLLLDRIGDVGVDADGQIYVVDVVATTVLVVDADGNYVRNIGSRGQGPGEFEYVSSVSFAGDSVFAWLPFRGASVFELASGEYRSQHRLPDLGTYGISGIVAQDGEFFLASANDGRPSGSPNKLLRFALGDGPVETVLTLPHSQVLKGDNGSITFPSYLRNTLCASALEKVYCGVNDELSFTVASSRGDSLGVLSVDFEPVRIGAVDRATWEDQYRGTEFASNLDIPEFWPAFSSIVGDDKGRLWIALHQAGSEEETTIWVVDPIKRVSSKVVVGGRLQLYDSAKGKLYGVHTNPEGERAVVRYAIGE